MSRRRTRLLLTVLAVAGLLWLLLLAESVPRASVDPLRVRHFRDKYRAAYAKDPPRNHEKWVSFAHERKCLADPSLYFQVMRDLDPWLRRGRIDPRSLATFWAARTGTFANGHFEFRTATRNAPQFYADTFHDIAHLLPETKNFTFLINLLDEPRIVPSQSRDGPYTSMEDVFLHNGCFRRKYAVPSSIASDYYNPHLRAIAGDASIRSQHSFLLSPTTFALENFLAPVFSQSKLDDCTNDVLVPLQYHHFFANASHTHDPIPWEDKKPVAFWRGTSTGGKLSKTSQWRQYGRFRMMDWEREWAKRHPGATFDASREELPSPKNLSIDFGFNKFVQADEDLLPILQQMYNLKGKVYFNQTVQYKYLPVVDGNAWPSRLQQYLQTNSVVLYNGIFTDFYTAQLKPMVHYVPFRLDYSDLEERLEWLMRNDDQAREISRNARELMRQWSNVDQFKCYVGFLMLEYSHLFDA